MTFVALRSSLYFIPRLPLVALLAGSLFFSACKKDSDTSGTPVVAPDVVAFTQAGLYPEGVQYDAANSRFLVTSLTTGKIGQVKDDGTYTVFAENPAIVSAIGLNLDEGRNRLLVAVSDPGANQTLSTPATAGKLAKLAIFKRDYPQAAPTIVDLGALRPGAAHFANDIAVDAQGNAYVTDSYSPLLYKVDAQTGVATVLLESPQFAAPAGKFGLNGIVYHPDGYLIMVNSTTGVLFKIPLANPSAFTTVSAPGIDLTAADGMLLQDNNTLQVSCNAQAKVYRLATTSGFTTASLSGTFATQPQFPTTLTKRAGADSYVLYANLDKLFAGQMPPVSQFSIVRVKF